MTWHLNRSTFGSDRRSEREFLANADSLFEGKGKSRKDKVDEENDHLLRIIGEQKVQIDF
jgi:transposase